MANDDDLQLTLALPASHAIKPPAPESPPRAACPEGAQKSTVVGKAHDHAFGIEAATND